MPAFSRHPWLLAATITTVGVAIGGIWEAVEWMAFHLALVIKPDENPLKDIVQDIMIDTGGAILAGPLAVWALGTRHVPPPTRRQLDDAPARGSERSEREGIP